MAAALIVTTTEKVEEMVITSYRNFLRVNSERGERCIVHINDYLCFNI